MKFCIADLLLVLPTFHLLLYILLHSGISMVYSLMKENAVEHLSGWFCFVQSSGGQVVSVFHSQSEEVEVVNIKKSIAAAFQANFKGSNEEIEIDPQSRHLSHYSYETTLEGSTKMHRTFTNDDVIEYPQHIPSQDVQLVEEEDIEYRDGRLLKSNGTIDILVDKAMPMSDNGRGYDDPDENVDGDNFPDMLKAHGSFTMELRVCRLVPHAARRKRRAVQQSLDSDTSEEEDLMASYDQKKSEMETLAALRQQLKTTKQVIAALQNLNKTYVTLEKVMVLEAKYTPLETFVTDTVLQDLSQIVNFKSEKYVAQRVAIYSLLSSAGSHKAQHALFESLLSAESAEVEVNSLTVAIASLENPSMELIESLEQLIRNTDGSTNLLLAYGALVANAAPDMESQMVSFLTERFPEDTHNNSYLLIHFLHALGNTQSQLAVEHILQYTQDGDEVVRLTAVTALRFFTDMPQVQEQLRDMVINSRYSEAVVDGIIDALRDGYDNNRGMTLSQELIEALANATLSLGNDDLQMELVQFYILIGTPETLSLADMIGSNVIQTRYRRASTRIWSSTDPAYSILCPSYLRAADVQNFPNYRAYLCNQNVGKTSGIYKFYLESVAGVFAGCNLNTDFKLIGKAVVRAHVFTSTRDVMRVLGSFTKQNEILNGKMYAKFGSSVLVNFDESFVLNYYQRYSLPEYRRQLFSFSYSFVIYSVRFSLTISVEARLRGSVVVDVNRFSGGRISMIPRATAYADGSLSLSAIGVRIGLTLTGSVSYATTCEGTITTSPCEKCVSIYDEWPDNHLTLSAFYQFRRLWGSWGRRRTWHPLTYTWNLSSSSGCRLLHRSCT